ncbi:MAG: undecaprenyl-phosphate glucose phosphotransferase [Beijerinckiaceae bacterium]
MPDDASYSENAQRPAASPRRKLAESLAGARTQTSYSPIVLSGIVRLAEFALVCLVGWALYALYVVPAVGPVPSYSAAVPAMAAVTVVLFQMLQLYTIAAFRTPAFQVLKLAGGWTLACLAAMAGIFFLKRGVEFSRVWLLSFYAAGLVALIAGRIAVYALVESMTRRGRLDRRTAIVGGGPAAEDLLRELAHQKNTDLKIYGVFDDRNEERSPEITAGFPKLGTVDDLVEFARHARLDLIIFTLPIAAEQRILDMLRKLWILPIDIRLAAHTNKLRLRPRAYSWIGGVPVLDVFDKPMAGWDHVLKYTFDKIVGALALVALSPVLLLTAIAIKLDSRGPVLFRQKRYGFNNELIEVYKFRSMYADQLDPTASKLVQKNDPRVTRVGRFIRKTSIDELPQLFNVVFKGNLSLVGPRPHAVHAKAADRLYNDVVDGYFARHRVRPGMTGWAQVNGWRGETDTPEKLQRRVEHDLVYIENWSILFDLYILSITPFALAKSENAY